MAKRPKIKDEHKTYPLTVSDWLSYLTSIKINYNYAATYHGSSKISTLALGIAFISLFLTLVLIIWTRPDIPFEIAVLSTFCISIVMFLISYYIAYKGYRKGRRNENYSSKCRNLIQNIINEIITNNLNKPDLIAKKYVQTVNDGYEKKLLKDLYFMGGKFEQMKKDIES